MLALVLFLLPWILAALYLGLCFRYPEPLPEADEANELADIPVSVIVPARNEEQTIASCLASLMGSDHGAFEIIVVDDGSQDRTSEVVEAVSRTAGVPMRLIRGAPLPPGWFGKPWACWQGARAARGTLLLFTDADTQHAPDLLRRSVAALFQSGAHALTLLGRQGMETFWERILQPQFFLLLAARYPRVGIPRRKNQWRNAVANGQYMLFRREAYEDLGGHEAVSGEVVDDIRLAQLLVKGGHALIIRETTAFYTRMYRSLGGIVEGWSKNVATAARQTTLPWLAPWVIPLSLLLFLALWPMPPVVLVASVLTGKSGLLPQWSFLATGLSTLIFCGASQRMKGNPLMGFFYPLASAVAFFIIFKSWWSGDRIRWRGRRYRMKIQ